MREGADQVIVELASGDGEDSGFGGEGKGTIGGFRWWAGRWVHDASNGRGMLEAFE